MVSTLSDMRIWSRALATGALLEPAVWAEATRNMAPFAFTGNYNGPGTWRYGLGFVESGGFIGGEGSFAGYESTTMYSPTLRTSIEVVSTKNPNAITPPPMFQALAMAVHGTGLGFGLTPQQALTPSFAGKAGQPDAGGPRCRHPHPEGHVRRTCPKRSLTLAGRMSSLPVNGVSDEYGGGDGRR